MKKFKRFVMSLLLSKRERVTIWNALWFSAHTYRRRGDVNNAVAVQMVMERVESIIGASNQTFTSQEVQNIVADVLEAADKANRETFGKALKRETDKAYRAGRSERIGEEISEMIAPLRPFGKVTNVEETENGLKVDAELREGMEIDKEKCEVCDNKDNCAIFQVIFGEEEGQAESEAKDRTEEEEISTEEKN